MNERDDKNKEKKAQKEKESKHIKKLKKRKKKLDKLRRNHLAGSILCMFIICVLAYAMTLTFTLSFLTNILDHSMEEALSKAQLVANVHDGLESNSTASDAVRSSIPERMDYFVMDGEGNISELHGKNTCCFDRDSSNVSVYQGDKRIPVSFYADEDTPKGMETPVIIEGEPWKLLATLFKEYSVTTKLYFTGEDISDEEIEAASYEFTKNNERLLYFHYWVSIPLANEENRLFMRSKLNITSDDVVMPMVMLLVFAGLMLILVAIVFTIIVTLTISKNKLIKMCFTDHVTNGNNQSCFETEGEEFVCSKKNSHMRFAVLNISFANYRNLSLSLSADDCDEMLRCVYKEIERFFGKKQCCVAHCTASNFGAIVRADNESALRAQLPMLITELENLTKLHTCCFQIGVDFIEKETNAHGTVIKREFADIPAHYGNASTARETLGDSDESGIAYFDEKLVKEQQWVNCVNENQQLALQNEEFLVYYQPKYDPTTNTLRGAEALIRWQSPEFGFVTPNRMIPIFEKNGFITEIDHYMITHVARDQKRWLDAGFKCVPVSVNVSRAHFIENDLAEQIRDSVDMEGAPHELIEIELTESAFFDDKKAMISTIEKLQSYGFTVSMDDFGSGYSSLNSLKDMPLDVLKLDAEFFRGKSENGRGEIVVSEAIRLAKSLNMRTVAEGVEIKEQVDFLAEQGCDMIQGYYYSKPIPPTEFEDRMRSGVSAPEQPLPAKQEEPAEIKNDTQEKESAELVTADDNRDR